MMNDVLPLAEGFEVQQNVNSDLGIVEYRFANRTHLTVAVTIHSDNDSTYHSMTLQHGLKEYARQLRDRCEAILTS
jgi:transposase InsO family protein